MKVKELIWSQGREEHIARHEVSITEFEEVVQGKHSAGQAKYGRYRLIGQTQYGRYLFLIIEEGEYGSSTQLLPGTLQKMKNTSTENRKSEKNSIPKFKSYREEAEFWDTHDSTDFEFKPVKLKVAKNLQHILGVRLDAKTIDQLEEKGHKIGVGASTLARMWIIEKLNSLKKSEQISSNHPKPVQHTTLHKIKISK